MKNKTRTNTWRFEGGGDNSPHVFILLYSETLPHDGNDADSIVCTQMHAHYSIIREQRKNVRELRKMLEIIVVAVAVVVGLWHSSLNALHGRSF